jgi:phospholipid/cholesterol/gamma-HCH transport system substrate-binding protein
VQEIVAAVDEGRGTDAKGSVGRLINDPTLANDIEEATESLREGVGSFSRFKSWLGLRVEWNIFSNAPRFFVTAEIRARTDKFYLVELERGPLGDFPDDALSDATGVAVYNRRQVIKDSVRFTAQFGKTFGGWLQIRGGIKESAFGFGSDVILNRGRLKLSADLYGGVDRPPRLKMIGALAVFRSVFLVAGIDDALNEPRYLDIREGAGEAPIQFDRVRFGRDYFPARPCTSTTPISPCCCASMARCSLASSDLAPSDFVSTTAAYTHPRRA